jgi:hypothetical protein
MGTWAVAILPLFGVVLGAALQFWLSRAAAREQHANTLRSQAYADYLRAVAAAGHLRSDEDLRDAHRGAADAKARIAVYGSTEVIKALSRFEEAGAVMTDAPAAQSFVALVSAMRSGAGAVSNHELELLLLGTSRQGAAPDAPASLARVAACGGERQRWADDARPAFRRW